VIRSPTRRAPRRFRTLFPGRSGICWCDVKTIVSSANYWASPTVSGNRVFPYLRQGELGGKDSSCLWIAELRRRRYLASYHTGNGPHPGGPMIDWLVEAFNPQQSPVVKDEFVHQANFKRLSKGES